jgi:ABC-type multidrug transport system fused ATPase/permease subunit
MVKHLYNSHTKCLLCLCCYFVRQDVAFFDANKTGQLVNRLTSDIQEFKSSFKLVISQVLVLQN